MASSAAELMSPAEFRAIQDLAHQSCGLHLPPEKREMVASRLLAVTRRIGISSFSEYHRHLLADRSGTALVEFIDTLTTNHTSFLRDPAHFELLTPALERASRGQEVLRIWSAACSTGEEPYSAAMTLLDAQSSAGWSILATDISTRALASARRAAYQEIQIGLVPAHWKHTYFERGKGEWQGWVRIRREVRDRVTLNRLNLLDELSFASEFHLIFCRNVMIYFDRQTREELVNRMCACLAPDGLFLVGSSERLMDLKTPLRVVAPGVYTRS